VLRQALAVGGVLADHLREHLQQDLRMRALRVQRIQEDLRLAVPWWRRLERVIDRRRDPRSLDPLHDQHDAAAVALRFVAIIFAEQERLLPAIVIEQMDRAALVPRHLREQGIESTHVGDFATGA
jgi:hypothetical protein